MIVGMTDTDGFDCTEPRCDKPRMARVGDTGPIPLRCAAHWRARQLEQGRKHGADNRARHPEDERAWYTLKGAEKYRRQLWWDVVARARGCCQAPGCGDVVDLLLARQEPDGPRVIFRKTPREVVGDALDADNLVLVHHRCRRRLRGQPVTSAAP